jgi:hypothetical protein
MARFYEVLRCQGVDEGANPPTMVVGFGKTSVVALADGEGFSVASSHAGVKVTEFRDPTFLISIANGIHNLLMQPGVDKKLQDNLSPDTVYSGRGATRYFSVFGKGLVGPPGTTIDAKSKGKSNNENATLRVVVVKEKKINLAICNLKVSDGQPGAGYVDHAKRPSVPANDVANMNAIWTPQSNISFSLISSDPLIIDDRLESTRSELRKAFGLNPDTVPQIGEVIDPNKLVDLFKARLQKSAEFTIVVARKAIDRSKNDVNGITISSGAFAVVTDLREFTTMAHEAGHYIGGHASKDGWVPQHHDTTNYRMLMRDGGAGYKIPFTFAMQCRRFPAPS